MAEAIRSTVKIEYSDGKSKEEPRVVLALTEYEAEVLKFLCACIGGDPKGPRGVLSDHKGSIRRVLSDLSVKDNEDLGHEDTVTLYGPVG